MTLNDLLSHLDGYAAERALVFQTDGVRIGEGYHVTELRHVAATGIDCGGHVEQWEEARLQLLDGSGQDYMTVGKFRAIVEKSVARLPELGNASLKVEFAAQNQGLHVLSLSAPFERRGAVLIDLQASAAQCKPLQRAKSSASCCGTAAVEACGV